MSLHTLDDFVKALSASLGLRHAQTDLPTLPITNLVYVLLVDQTKQAQSRFRISLGCGVYTLFTEALKQRDGRR